jgi:hypothetical protein
MKLLLYISLIFILSACGQNLTPQNFLNTELTYSSYLWHLNSETDKNEFYLASYLHIDSSGKYKLIRHSKFLDDPQYFSGSLSDSFRKVIDSILLENKYFPAIRKDGAVDADTSFLIYDGFTYLLDYKIRDSDRAKVQYINSSHSTPENILFLTSLLDTIIFKSPGKRIDSFSIGRYADTLRKISSYNLPPPPKRPRPPNIESIKFLPPKVRKLK